MESLIGSRRVAWYVKHKTITPVKNYYGVKIR